MAIINSVDIKFESVVCEDIGMYVIGKYPRFEYGVLTSSAPFNWKLYTYTTLRLALLNLLNNGVVEIEKIETYRSSFFTNNVKKEVDFRFKVVDLQLDKDWLSVNLYKAINEVNKSEQFNLSMYIHEIMDTILTSYAAYNNPSRAFIINLLKQYAKIHKWITIEKTKEFSGILDKFRVKIEEIYIPRINMQHEALVNLDNQLYKTNVGYRVYCNVLDQSTHNELWMRKNKNGKTFID